MALPTARLKDCTDNFISITLVNVQGVNPEKNYGRQD